MLAQKIVDTAEGMGLSGHFMNQVLFRKEGNDKDLLGILDREWPEDRLSCTLDFIETKDGLLLLEGGPGHVPGGGGHPCAFAGQGVNGHPAIDVARCQGVAYLCMPNVNLAEPKTWRDGDPGASIHDWGQAVELAVRHADLDEETLSFLERVGVTMTDPGLSP